MSLDRKLKLLFDLVRDEAKRNAEFRHRLEDLFDDTGSRRRPPVSADTGPEADAASNSVDAAAPRPQKRGNRRPQALFDPIAECDRGEAYLRDKLAALTLEQLRDVVADFRMDPSKLVMKWKDRERVVNHIVATALSRRQKGDAFRA